jgi:hypothetical protein
VDELATKLGPEYIALMNGLQDMDPDSEDAKEISSTLEALEKLCSKRAHRDEQRRRRRTLADGDEISGPSR